MNVLQEAKQQIDPRLAEMARYGGGGGGGRFGGGGYRGRGGGGGGGGYRGEFMSRAATDKISNANNMQGGANSLPLNNRRW